MIYPLTFEEKIGFDRIRQLITEKCLCDLGKVLVQQMTFLTDYSDLVFELDKTDEFKRIVLLEDTFPIDHYIDSTACLMKIKVQGAYPELSELADLRRSYSAITSIAHFFSTNENKNKYPRLAAESAAFNIVSFLNRNIDSILDKNDLIKDSASAELKEVRSKLKKQQGVIAHRIKTIFESARKNGLVGSDAEITVRNGRPVIPVSSGLKRKLSGIVHDESATGKTVFIEPAAIVELNNEIRELEYAEKREIIKILVVCADLIRPHIEEILPAYEFLGKIDFIRAKALLAIKINAVRPVMQDKMSFSWIRAVHPLLYLSFLPEKKEVVPVDINLDEKNRILVISGPNAGGKTVCLKTAGLLQFMVQCGMLVPVNEKSEFCLFRNIFIDIGDDQSIENDLSTYSSHLNHMKFFVKNSDSSTLVLIDELGTGTEPAIGGAIAEAILIELNSLGSYGIITTHYSNLKHCASETPGIINGAMLFDTQKIKPLFKLVLGKPGSSFAIDLARMTGLPERILEDAAKRLGEDQINYDKYLRDISRDRKYWEDKRSRIRNVEKTLDNLYLQYGEELEDISKERKRILAEAKAEALEIINQANKAVEGTIRKIIESKADKEKTRHARKELIDRKQNLETDDLTIDPFAGKLKNLEHAKERLRKYNPDLVNSDKREENTIPVDTNELKIGDKVRIKDSEMEGEILEVNEKSVLVSFGTMITTVKANKLEPVAITIGNEKSVKTKKGYSDNLTARKLNFKNYIDVRGKRADEALAMVQAFLDDAVMVSVAHLSILHGKGNGILRQLIRDYLSTLNIIKSYKDEHADKGGNGITLVEMDL